MWLFVDGVQLRGRPQESRCPFGLPPRDVAVSFCSAPSVTQACVAVWVSNLLSSQGWALGPVEATPGMTFVIRATFQARPTQPLPSFRHQASCGSFTWRLASALGSACVSFLGPWACVLWVVALSTSQSTSLWGPENAGVATRGPSGACGLANLGAKELKLYWCSVLGGQK